MIEFRIYTKIYGGEVQIWEVLEKCQNCRFFDIFSVILDKMKDNFGQECVKGGLLSFQC